MLKHLNYEAQFPNVPAVFVSKLVWEMCNPNLWAVFSQGGDQCLCSFGSSEKAFAVSLRLWHTFCTEHPQAAAVMHTQFYLYYNWWSASDPAGGELPTLSEADSKWGRWVWTECLSNIQLKTKLTVVVRRLQAAVFWSGLNCGARDVSLHSCYAYSLHSHKK